MSLLYRQVKQNDQMNHLHLKKLKLTRAQAWKNSNPTVLEVLICVKRKIEGGGGAYLCLPYTLFLQRDK